MVSSQWRVHLPWAMVGAFALTLGLLSCSAFPTINVTTRIMPVQSVPAPTGVYYEVVWLADAELVTQYEREPDLPSPAPDKRTYQLWRVQTNGQNLQLVNLPAVQNQGCNRTEFNLVQILTDGRLAFMRECVKLTNPRTQVMAWNPRDDSITLLRDYVLPNLAVLVSFAPNPARGIGSSDSGIADVLYWLDQSGARQFDVGMVRATRPVWSPDGKSIVFFGNQSGSFGPANASAPIDLWLMPADCEASAGGCVKATQRLVTGITDQILVRWSPDSRWLAFDGRVGFSARGIWLRNMDSGEVIQVAAGLYRNPYWSPDGRRLVVIGLPDNADGFNKGSALSIIDVSAIVSK